VTAGHGDRSTDRSDERSGDRAGHRAILLLRLLLVLAYLPLAHVAGSQSSPFLAALALIDIALVLLIEPLCAARAWAWVGLLAAVVVIVALLAADLALVPLLLMPVLFIGLGGWWFARSLAPGREPLITRIVIGIYAQAQEDLTPQHRRYTRQLTVMWAALMALLAAINLALALIAVPDGVLAQFGVSAPLTVTQGQWSLFANVLNYGIVAGAMVVEYHWRKRIFLRRPYRNFGEFVRQMAALGPGFWRDLFR
jgi:uncharacterized membrane protein